MKVCSIEQDNFNIQDEFQYSALQLLCKYQKGCRAIYDVLISNNVKPATCTKWAREINLHESFNWSKTFKRPFSVTKDSTLIWLQTRILHNILATNTLLVKLKLASSDKCSFCKTERETILHLFWECPQSNRFWLDLSQFLTANGVLQSDIEINLEAVIFGGEKIGKLINLILLVAKRYLYNVKMNKGLPQLNIFKTVLYNYYKVEKRIALITDKQESFEDKWRLLEDILHINSV